MLEIMDHIRTEDWMALELDSYQADVLDDVTVVMEEAISSNLTYPNHLNNSAILGLLGDLSGHSLFFMENAEEMLLPWKNNPNFVPIIITHAITFVVGLVGNIVVISAMSRSRGERSVTSMFLVSLAVADLLLVAVCAPLETMGYFLNPWTRDGSLCQLQSYVEMLSAVASVLNLTAVSLERYIVIVYPMKSRSFCTLRNCRRALIAVWIISLILTAPVIITRESVTYIYYNNETAVAVHYCMDTKGDLGQGQGFAAYTGFIIAVYQLAIMFVLPLLLMVICYSRVIKELWLSTKQISAMTRDYSSSRTLVFQTSASGSATPVSPSSWAASGISASGTATSGLSNASTSSVGGRIQRRLTTAKHFQQNHVASQSRGSDGQAKQARKQVIKMLILVVILFLVCWGPRLLLNVLIKWGLSSFDSTIYRLRISFYLMPFIHSCLNPIIYSFMSSNFRRMLRRSCDSTRRRCARTFCCSHMQPVDDYQSRHPHSTAFEMSNGTGLRRHTSAYCPSMATTEAVLGPATGGNLSGPLLYNDNRPGFSVISEGI